MHLTTIKIEIKYVDNLASVTAFDHILKINNNQFYLIDNSKDAQCKRARYKETSNIYNLFTLFTNKKYDFLKCHCANYNFRYIHFSTGALRHDPYFVEKQIDF